MIACGATWAVLLLLASGSPAAPRTAEAEAPASVDLSPSEVVACREAAFSDAAEGKDWKAFASFVHPEARFVGAGLTRGPEEITAAWRSAFDSPQISIRWRPRHVELLRPDLALSRGPYRVRRPTADGSVQESWGTFNSLWSLDSGEWRVLFDLGSEGIEAGDRELLEAPTPACDTLG